MRPSVSCAPHVTDPYRCTAQAMAQQLLRPADEISAKRIRNKRKLLYNHVYMYFAPSFPIDRYHEQR